VLAVGVAGFLTWELVEAGRTEEEEGRLAAPSAGTAEGEDDVLEEKRPTNEYHAFTCAFSARCDSTSLA
jgi:hypothetical protein